ncbi:formate dehydrogenase accessory protein FdhE [Bartonella henselae]|uniref:Formate dehydrogenase accessory protein FdhE n=2 Tax=Bartonella TaxID=773 RepID=A0A0H3M440_BARHE|nr:formate dehydrogenase accessory protein FdhE [Bartonella henselae]ATP12817.1 formate dehydrogenase accessory protein FdhE [Bartonella henselae]ETS07287.1 formate dehydrogenase accessory protein FdhE [Bartonella henselae JK 50]ETS07467.1 formate dehydrogenase accessory protein FdhE [Bartonella henselae JK 51]ETS11472.1 formate dehydrogenase accessory protein FdhE [Bartonella henselae JK 42]ETS15478.1 formate dehydrogenase accessory protein FdhE [Bartonella henselae JK 41]
MARTLKTKLINKDGRIHSSVFVILPDVKTVFAKRTQRFTHLANEMPNKECLLFFADFCNAQQQSIEKFKDFAIPLSRFGTTSTSSCASPPSFDHSKLLSLGLYSSIVKDFLQRLSPPTLSVRAFSATRHKALKRTQQQEDQWRLWAENLLNHRLPQQQLAEHLFIIGTLQIMYSLAASQLDGQSLLPQPDNLCPACGGTHSASIIIEREPRKTIRMCSCLYCNTLWHTPQSQCTFCAATQNISTCAIENTPNDIVLETCKTCGRYCKQLNSYQNPVLDVFADDINTPTPDFLQQGSFHFKHGNFNPFLAEERR